MLSPLRSPSFLPVLLDVSQQDLCIVAADSLVCLSHNLLSMIPLNRLDVAIADDPFHRDVLPLHRPLILLPVHSMIFARGFSLHPRLL